jgi:hypothetical protein
VTGMRCPRSRVCLRPNGPALRDGKREVIAPL